MPISAGIISSYAYARPEKRVLFSPVPRHGGDIAIVFRARIRIRRRGNNARREHHPPYADDPPGTAPRARPAFSVPVAAAAAAQRRARGPARRGVPASRARSLLCDVYVFIVIIYSPYIIRYYFVTRPQRQPHTPRRYDRAARARSLCSSYTCIPNIT